MPPGKELATQSEPTDEQLNGALDRAKRAGTVPPDTQLNAVRRELSNFLTVGKRREVKEECIDQLYIEFGVRMNLDAIGRPQVPFRMDGPSRGPVDAAVVIVEYTDFRHPEPRPDSRSRPPSPMELRPTASSPGGARLLG